MDAHSGDPEANRPYGPPSSVIAVLERLRNRNLPERIDADYLRDAGISDGLVGRTMFGLRFLGLVSGDMPSEALRSISTSTDEEYRSILQELLRAAYAEVFEVLDPAEDAQDQFLNFFRRYTPASQRSRMVTYFLGICRASGIQTVEAPQPRRTSASASGKPQARAKPKPSGKRASPAVLPSDHGPRLTKNVPAPILMLMEALPPEGAPLPPNRREQWIDLARQALTFVYPEDLDPQPDDEVVRNDEEVA